MCLAVPGQIVSVADDGCTAQVRMGGVAKPVDVSLIDAPEAGDWVIVHVGFALNRIDEDEAQRTLSLLAAAGGSSAESASFAGVAP